jgi:hypothetical protein
LPESHHNTPLTWRLFARAAAQVLEFGLALFGFLALGFTDEESATSDVFCSVQLVFCQLLAPKG